MFLCLPPHVCEPLCMFGLTRRACSHPSDWEVWLTKCLRFSRVLHYSWSREACVRQTFFYFSLVNNSCGCTHVNSRQTSEVLGATLKPGLDFWGPPGHRPWMWTCNITARKDPRMMRAWWDCLIWGLISLIITFELCTTSLDWNKLNI